MCGMLDDARMPPMRRETLGDFMFVRACCDIRAGWLLALSAL